MRLIGLVQITHLIKLARIPIFICHSSLCLLICEPWQATGQQFSAEVLLVHFEWWLLWQHPLPLAQPWLQGPFLWLRSWTPIKPQSHLLQGHVPCTAMCVVTVLEPERSHHRGHHMIFLSLALCLSSLFFKIPV